MSTVGYWFIMLFGFANGYACAMAVVAERAQ